MGKYINGDCYDANGKLFSDISWRGKVPFSREDVYAGKIVIVHGAPTLRGGPYTGNKFGHCWIESDDTVYDFSNGNEAVLPKDLYYALGNIDPKENVSYTINEYRKKIVEEGTWGPWEGPSPENEWLKQ